MKPLTLAASCCVFAALAAGSGLSAAQRAEARAPHASDDHGGAVATPAEAKKIPGIK